MGMGGGGGCTKRSKSKRGKRSRRSAYVLSVALRFVRGEADPRRVSRSLQTKRLVLCVAFLPPLLDGCRGSAQAALVAAAYIL